MALLLRHGNVLLPSGIRTDIDVRVDGAVVDRIGADLPSGGAACVDASGLLVAPGFIDLHIHGAGGGMCEDGDAAALARISATLARGGVTGFLATLAALPAERLRAAVDAVVTFAGSEPGARIAGIHLEGPYLNPQRAGAQAAHWIRPPSIEEFDALQALANGGIRLVTVAPEVDGALAFIAAVRARGVTVAIGHSDATAAETELGIEAGASHVTHLFNAMRAPHHREPGMIGPALTVDTVSVELICDGHHVAPAMIDLVWRCKPRGKLVVVSDAVAPLGMPDGDYELFGVACTKHGGAIRRRDGDGLAGSCVGMDRAVRNLRRWLPRLALEDILAAASSAPASVVGEAHAGFIEEGRAADLVLLDRDLAVVATICKGAVAWRRSE
jgi:N-acetylglucosamine-6-phosphate deacetylase